MELLSDFYARVQARNYVELVDAQLYAVPSGPCMNPDGSFQLFTKRNYRATGGSCTSVHSHIQ